MLCTRANSLEVMKNENEAIPASPGDSANTPKLTLFFYSIPGKCTQTQIRDTPPPANLGEQ